MSGYDNNKINITVLKQHKNIFDDESNRFNNSTYSTFSSSYLNSCSDSYVNSLTSKLREHYQKIQKGYESINKWWNSYNENIEGLELSLAKQSSIGSITEGSVRSFVSSKLSELSDYQIEYSGVFVDNYYNGNPVFSHSNVDLVSTISPTVAMAGAATIAPTLSDDNILDSIGAAFANAKSMITSWLSGIKNGISNALEQVGAFITSLGATVSDKASELANDFANGVKEVKATIGSTAQSLWNGFTDWVTGTAWPFIQSGAKAIADVYQTVYATIAVGVQSLVKGVLQFVEALVDFVVLVGGAVGSVFTGIYDGGQAIYGAITGNEWHSATKSMWGGIQGFVATNYVNGWFDAMTGKQDVLAVNGEALMTSDGKYLTISDVQLAQTQYGEVLVTLDGEIVLTSTGEPAKVSDIEQAVVYTTGYGKWLNEYSLIAPDGIVANVLSGIGYIAGVVALTIATFGVGGVVATGGTVSATTAAAATTATNFAITAGAAGMGRGTAEAWNDGANTVEGLGYGVATGLWEAFQFWSGAKINGLQLLKPTTMGRAIFNSGTHILLDGASGASEGFVQPLFKMIYKNNDEMYSDMNVFETYTQLFDENGGWITVGTGATIGTVASGLSEIPGLINISKQINFDKQVTSILGDELSVAGKNLWDTDLVIPVSKLKEILTDEAAYRQFLDFENNRQLFGSISKEQYVNALKQFETALENNNLMLNQTAKSRIATLTSPEFLLGDITKVTKIFGEEINIGGRNIGDTAVMIPIAKLQEILTDDTVYKQFLDFENNKHIFGNISQQEYITALRQLSDAMNNNNLKLNSDALLRTNQLFYADYWKATLDKAELIGDANIYLVQKARSIISTPGIDSTLKNQLNSIIGKPSAQIDTTMLKNALEPYLTPNELIQLTNIEVKGSTTAWLNSLTDNERHAIFQYTKAGGNDIASALRNNGIDMLNPKHLTISQVEEWMNNYQIKSGTGMIRDLNASSLIDDIDSALNKGLNTETIQAVRYINDVGGQIDFSNIRNLNDLVGLTFSDKAYTSFTVLDGIQTAYSKGTSIKLETTIMPGTGAFIEPASGLSSYSLLEFLAKRDTTQTIIDAFLGTDGKLVLRTVIQVN